MLESSLYPGASHESIKLVIGYCTAAGLDPIQKPVHIVPIWDSRPVVCVMWLCLASACTAPRRRVVGSMQESQSQSLAPMCMTVSAGRTSPTRPGARSR